MVAIKIKMFVTLYVAINILQVFNGVLAAPQQGNNYPSFPAQPAVVGLANGSAGGSPYGSFGGSANRPVGGSPNGLIGGSANGPVGGSPYGSAGGLPNGLIGGSFGESANGPVGGLAGVPGANGQQSSIPWEMINQARQNFKDTLMATGVGRMVDVIDTANLATKFVDNRMGDFTDIVHNTFSMADRLAKRKAQYVANMIEMAGGSFGGLISGAQSIGGAGAGAVQGVYDGAVGTTANIVRAGGRVAALPLKMAKGVTGIIGGERSQPTNNPITSRKLISAY
ncbi:circumsporozoite protein-like isoform X2 [Adelges cooleyi]|uniref:circumsporozoite protein-like isoform X2 n=1 Tax=Adelges cooleyi TaxID=133065 RepID=UPI00217FF5EB|nr:circumsporozoite protein-like isoform X2 [Adelges cooleyi]